MLQSLCSRAARGGAARLLMSSKSHQGAMSMVQHQQQRVAGFSTETEMFCFQCEQTDQGTGCSTVGICGKEPETAALQDALVHVIKGIGMRATDARAAGATEDDLKKANEFTLEALFSTLTNVNFDADVMHKYIDEALVVRDSIGDSSNYASDSPANWQPMVNTKEGITKEAHETLGVLDRKAAVGDDVSGLQELVMYGLKGTAAYAHHAYKLGGQSDDIFQGIHSGLAVVGRNETDINALLGAALGVGETNVSVLAKLDESHNERFGTPAPTVVKRTPIPGKCILVSGHDMHDLECILKQTEGKGINVYTHGELLPAHSYPGLKEKFPHLVGNYGGPWQLQKFEFAKFPGPIVMTTNCLMEPRKQYKDRLFTAGVTGWPGITSIEGDDFSAVVESALACEGFKEDDKLITKSREKDSLTGFNHRVVMSVADQVINAAAAGDLERIVLIGGCDGTEGERSYYTKLADGLPQESLILTLGCGKFRLLNKEYGNLPNTEIPRLLDMGQCNDSYSAVVVASELAKALDTDINSLPLSIVLSWLEQKAVAVLLSLLHLGVRDIRIGPSLPAFVTPNVLNVLVENYNLTPVHSPDTDVETIVADVMKQ